MLHAQAGTKIHRSVNLLDYQGKGLVRAFGKPDLKARTMQQERLIETYIYEQQDRATLVLIQDGSVVSARTGQPQQVRVLPSEPEPDN